MWALVGVWYAGPKAGTGSRADTVNRVPAQVYVIDFRPRRYRKDRRENDRNK